MEIYIVTVNNGYRHNGDFEKAASALINGGMVVLRVATGNRLNFYYPASAHLAYKELYFSPFPSCASGDFSTKIKWTPDNKMVGI